MLFLCSQRRDMEPPLIVQTESEEVLQEQQLRQRQKRRLSSTPVSQRAGRLVLMLLLWQYFSISQGLCTYEETSFLFVLPFTPFSFFFFKVLQCDCEWGPCAYVIVYGKLPPSQSFCGYCWVANQNGFH